jgi:hypothetical protein
MRKKDKYFEWYSCKSKKKYKKKSWADRDAIQKTYERGIIMVSYFCELCKGWHLTTWKGNKRVK